MIRKFNITESIPKARASRVRTGYESHGETTHPAPTTAHPSRVGDDTPLTSPHAPPLYPGSFVRTRRRARRRVRSAARRSLALRFLDYLMGMFGEMGPPDSGRYTYPTSSQIDKIMLAVYATNGCKIADLYNLVELPDEQLKDGVAAAQIEGLVEIRELPRTLIRRLMNRVPEASIRLTAQGLAYVLTPAPSEAGHDHDESISGTEDSEDYGDLER